MGFVVEVLFEIVLQALFEGVFYGLRRLWYWATGQETKEETAVISHHEAKLERRHRLDDIRRRRGEKKKR